MKTSTCSRHFMFNGSFSIITMQLLMLLLFFVPETMAIRKVEHHCIHAESRVQRLIIGNTNTSAYSHESNNNNKRKSNNNNDNEEEEKEGLNTGYEHQKSDNARKSLQGSKSKSRVKRFNIARRNKKLSNKKDNDGKIKLKNGTETWEPLRIVVDTSLLVDPSKICTAVGQVRTDFMGSTHTCLSQDIMTLEKVWIIENVALPLAIYRVQQLLNVNPLQGPLLVTKNICGPDVTIPESHSTVGVLDADMILYAHAGGMDNSATPGVMGTIAWAAHCELNEAGRPIVGHINFVPSFIQWFVSGWEYEYYVRIIIHELLHALGFTPTFIDPMVNISERRGKSVHLVTAPAVIAAAQTHLSCPTLDGVELEDEGGSGTAWTHWERRGWMDELMAGIPSRAAISALTLAFFSSLNLYTVNMEYNETMSWSYHAGCPFLEERCVANAQRMGFEWCNDTSTAQLCTFDRLAVGLCNTGLVPNLPPYFQYFPAEPMRAGVTPLMDYCPIVVGYGNRQCTQPVESTSDDALYGFYFGTQSRCVPTHNMVKKGYTIDDNNPRCLMVRCRLGKQVEVFVGSYWLECPADGSAGVITIPAYTGYNGEIHCERAEKVCSSTLFYNPDSAASASTVDEGPLREYALDVILLLNTTVSGNKSNVMHTLGRMATVEPGMFFILLQEEITTLCKCKLGTSNIRILPEYASAAVVNGGIVVNFQLGLMIGAGSATIENMRNMYESKFMVNSVLSRIGAYITEEEKEEEGGIFTVTIASSEILPEAVIVDEITSLDQLVALGEIHLHCKGDLTGMPSLTDQKVITLLENAVRQDISQIILLTPNLIEVKHLQITGSTDLLITLTVYFPPVADGIGGNENILHLWEQLLMNSTTITITTTITSMPSPLPVLTSTVQFLSKGAPVSVTDNISSSSALSLFSADVSEVQPDSTGDSRCVVQFTGCFAVQIVILIILILIVLIMIVVFLKLCLCPKPKWRIQVETCELVVPLQEKYR